MRYLLAIILPPVAVLLCGKPLQFVLNIILTLCFWIPGVIHAILVVNNHLADKRAARLEKAIREGAILHTAKGASSEGSRNGTSSQISAVTEQNAEQKSGMEGRFLNETYSVCGKTFEVYAKTGRYKGPNRHGSYEFFREDSDGEESFTITPELNLTADLGLELEDRVSMAMFGEYYGQLFLLFNHRNSKYCYYPEAIDDLFWKLRDGWPREIIVAMKLKKEAKTFTNTQAFSKVLKKLQAL